MSDFLFTTYEQTCYQFLHTHKKKVDRDKIATGNTPIYGNESHSEILLLGEYCEGCKPAEESSSIILNFCLLYYTFFMCLHDSLWRLFFIITFLNLVNLQCGKPRFYPWVGKIPRRRKQQPIPVLFPGKSHGPRSLVGFSPWGHKESDMTE